MEEVQLFFAFINSIVYLLVILIAVFFYKSLDKQSNKIQLIDLIMILMLIIVTGIRFEVGSDYLSYLDEYKKTNLNLKNIIEIFLEDPEIGFSLLSYFLKSITANEYAIFWGISIIIYPLLIIYMRKNTEIVWFAFATFLLLGFFDVSMNILKQQVAMVLILFSYEYLIEKKYIKFVLITMLAGIFHITAIIAAFLLVISRFIKPTYKNLFRSIIIGIVALITYKFFLVELFSYNTIFSKYESYLLIQDSKLNRNVRVYSVIGYAFVFILISFILLSKNKNLKSIMKEKHKMISLLFIGIIINILAIDYWVLNRIALYMYQFIIVLLPAYLKVKMNKKERLINTLIISFILINWFIVFFLTGGNNTWHTYDTYLFK